MKFWDLSGAGSSKFLGSLFVCLVISLGVSNCAIAQPFPYKFNYLTVDEGLSHTDANIVAQDKLGFIWVGTNFGLDRYDGYTVKKHYNKNVPVDNAFKNRIFRIFPDEEGKLWLATEAGLQRFDPSVEKYTDFKEANGKGSPFFLKMFKPEGDLIWGLVNAGIRLYRIDGNTLTDQKLQVPAGVVFTDMEADRKGGLYFSSDHGIWKLGDGNRLVQVGLKGLSLGPFSGLSFDRFNNMLVWAGKKLFLASRTSNAQLFNVTRSHDFDGDVSGLSSARNGDIWVNTGAALVRLDRSFNFIQLLNNRSSLQSLNANVLACVYIDRSDCLWVGTSGGGLNFCDLNQKMFYTMQHNPEDPNSLAGSRIRCVLEDGEHLWVGTNANGLNLYNLKTQRFELYNSNGGPVKLKNNVITALMIDDAQNLWIGSYGGIEILKADRRSLWKPPGYEKFPTHSVETLAQDCFGNIWYGNLENFGVIWKDDAGVYRVRKHVGGHFVLADKNKPHLVVSSREGLKRLIIDRQGNISETIYYRSSSSGNSLTSNYTFPIVRQNDSTFWIGTIGGGLNRLSLNPHVNAYSIKQFSEPYGVFNDVETLEIDNDGKIWMGGNGLECFDPRTDKLIRYDKNDGLQGNSFKIRASNRGADGRLYFGGINGLNYFYPAQIKANHIEARPVFTGILINNKIPDYGSEIQPGTGITEAIGYRPEIELDHGQNNFVISFSSMHFANPLKCRYRYKLEGHDEMWNNTDGSSPRAAYSNLDYGRYRLIVEATNNDGVWSKFRAETTIVITPPWWKSDLAKFLYILLFLFFLMGIYFYQARWHRLKREIELRAVNEKKREEIHAQREELYQQQLTFFTNISHEFRTPLTLIMGPLENMINNNQNAGLDHSYQLIYRNAKRLMNLISELMNFKKISDSLVRLQVQPLNINKFCRELVMDFHSLAKSKGITLTMLDRTENNVYWPHTGLFDVQVLEKIMLNLLNNALKYTHTGGEITFEIFSDIQKHKPSFGTSFKLLNEKHRAGKYLYFKVLDSGVGIASDAIYKIFDRYYRISREQLGSGVGLALVKSLTQLHKGDIYVYSEQGKGTEIIIGIPLGDENYDLSERAPAGTEPEVRLEAVDNSVLAPLSLSQKEASLPVGNKHLLIVDDNEELRLFLRQTFEKYYQVYEAEDGDQALEIAMERIPDLIISDVMMPGMSGIELCKIMKERFETSHIPFIILSAKDALATKIEGLESGADFYFAKPLSIDLLLLTVHNIFGQSEKLKQRYTNNYLSEATELVHSEKDKAFFQTLLALIEDNIEDPDLDVEFLCKHLYISRTKLYQKIKSITDQSVGDFIRTIRLKKAIQIMTHEDIAVNKVVDRVGMQSSSNFSRAFKKEFGKSPLQFMQSLKKTT